MVGLALHGSQTTLHPGHPFDDFPVLVAVIGEGNAMFGIVFGREVELDTGAFEDGFAAFFGGFVDDGGDTAVCWR